MKSKYADYFNHDEDADYYDDDVKNELNPVRTGYSESLKWIGKCVSGFSNILDLGTGTGNTIIELPKESTITAIDVSTKMLNIAKSKLLNRKIEYITADVLDYVETVKESTFNAIVSSYVLHHLIEKEKEILLNDLYRILSKHGIVLIVDLMYENEDEYKELLNKYKNANQDAYDCLTDEFLWNITKTKKVIKDIGFSIEMKRFSELNWGILLKKGGI